MTEKGGQSHPPQPSGGYEKRDTNVRGIVWVTLISAVIIVLSVIMVNELFIATKEEIVEEVVLKPESVPLRELRARETSILESYDVIDAPKGIYRIPIERAMKLMAERAYERESQSK